MTENVGRDASGAGRGWSRRWWKRSPGVRRQTYESSALIPRSRAIPPKGTVLGHLGQPDLAEAGSGCAAAEMHCTVGVDAAAGGRVVESLAVRMIACSHQQRRRRRGAERLATEGPVLARCQVTLANAMFCKPDAISAVLVAVIDNERKT